MLSPILQRIRIARTFDTGIMLGTVVATLLNHDGMMWMNLHDDDDSEGLDFAELESGKALYKTMFPVANPKQKFTVGQKVLSRFRTGYGTFYPGVVIAYNELQNDYNIKYDDGDVDNKVKKLRIKDVVEVRCSSTRIKYQ